MDPEIKQDNDLFTNRRNLISLKDIIMKQHPEINSNGNEAYIMLHEESPQGNINRDITLVVKRTKLIFNDKECVVLNFQDVSLWKRLKHEEQKGKLMSTLYSSVHHEMLGPLKNNVETALRLVRRL